MRETDPLANAFHPDGFPLKVQEFPTPCPICGDPVHPVVWVNDLAREPVCHVGECCLGCRLCDARYRLAD
jgi:hypothetical protein